MRIKSYTGDESTRELLKQKLKENALHLQIIAAVIIGLAVVIISTLGIETYHILNATTAGQVNIALLSCGAILSLLIARKVKSPSLKTTNMLMIVSYAVGLVMSSLAAFGIVSGVAGAAGSALAAGCGFLHQIHAVVVYKYKLQ